MPTWLTRSILLLGIIAAIDRAAAEAQLRTQTIVSGLSQLVAAVADPVQPGVFYAVQQNGVVQTVQGSTVLPTPFLDVRTATLAGGERGLLGMAFAPDTSSGRVFVNFTNTDGDTVVARFRRSAANPLVVDPASRFDLRWPGGSRVISQPFANHNGGNLVFGPDGYLYIGLGDGGSGNDPNNNAQNPNSLLGKMLRIDVSVPDADPAGYRVPPDNPFVRGAPIAALGEIWAFGLRNPWRYAFDDPALGGTGALFIGDVGQNAREEIDVAPAGRGGQNYGWRIREGTIATAGVDATAPAFTPLTEPMLDYGRSDGVTVIGGRVYRGRALGADFFGRYFFADAGSGRLWSAAWQIDPATGRATATSVVDHSAEIGALGSIVSFGEDLSGELYLVVYGFGAGGGIVKLVADRTTPAAPTNLTSQTSERAVTLMWNGVSGATQYRIEAGSRAGASDLAVIDTASAQTSFTANGVGDGVYYVRVRAINGATAGAESNEIVIAIGAGPCTGPPSPPIGLSSTLNGRLVSLTWIASGTITSFVLEAGSAPGASDAAVVVLAPSARAFSSNASPGTYYARVRAMNACGSSAASNELAIAVP
jgi:glucose/arabinose dehydrogenase